MKPLLRLRQQIADADYGSSFASRARAKRWALLRDHFQPWETMRVLDLGGTALAWRAAEVAPAHVTLVNLSDQGHIDEPWITAVVGDACAPPPEVQRQQFDLVYSNSLIEHVGGHARRTQFAQFVRDAAPHYWVQTPNRYFPVEPHFLFPGFQFLPPAARSFISKNWSLGWYSQPTVTNGARLEGVLEIELIGATELGHYFPDSRLVRERWFGLTKSLIAIR